VWSIQPVGAFSETNIEYLYPVAGRVSAINLSFVPRMSIRTGEELIMVFPQFTGESFSGLDLLPSGTGKASWNTSSYELTIKIGPSCIMRDSSFTMIVPSAAGLRLPPRGVKPRLNPITIRTTAFDGPVLPIPFGSATSLGSFSRTSLEYFLPSLRATVQLNLNFSSVMDLKAGEFVALTLPGFLGTEVCDINVKTFIDGAPSTAIRKATWMGSKTRVTATLPCIKNLQGIPNVVSHNLVMQLLEDIPMDAVVRVEVPKSAGISSRPDGVLQNDVRLALWTNAAEGQVAYTFPIPIDRSLPLYANATLLESSVRFGLPKAGEVSNISIMLRLNSLLYFDDTIRVALPGFLGGVPSTSMPINITSLGGDVADFLTGVWSTGPNAVPTLLFTVHAFIEPNVTIRIDVSKNNGIMLPVTGVRTTPQNNVIVQIQGIAGVLQPRNFHAIDFVGAFCDSSIVFEKPPQAPTARTKIRASMKISICAEFKWELSDKLVFYLPGFTGPDSSGVKSLFQYPGKNDGLIDGAWDNHNKELIFTVTTRDVLAEKASIFIFVSTHDIYLPTEGLRTNQATLGISAVAKAGVVIKNPPTPIITVEAVGTFADTPVLTFGTPKAFEPTEMTLAFVPMMRIPPSSTITMRLPFFTGPPALTGIVIRDTVSGTNVNASWSPASQKLVFTIPDGFTIQERQNVSFVVPESLGLTIPKVGVRLNQSVGGIILFTDSVDGPIREDPETPIATVQAVGSLTDTLSVAFNPPKAGAPTRITITFTTSMELRPGDTLTFILTGIVGKSETVRVGPPSEYPARFNHATWTLSQSTLVFTVSSTVAENETVSVLVPSSSGLMLPADGLRSFSSGFRGFTYSIRAIFGSIPKAPLSFASNFTAIGTLNGTSLTLGSGTCPGAVSSWMLVFTPTMNMSTGDVVTLTVPGLGLAMCNCSSMAPGIDGQSYCIGNWSCPRTTSGSNTSVSSVSMAITAIPSGSFRTNVTWVPPTITNTTVDLIRQRGAIVKVLSGGNILSFTVDRAIPNGTYVNITIQESQGIRAPRNFASFDGNVSAHNMHS
jgi:hypothetical protein